MTRGCLDASTMPVAATHSPASRLRKRIDSRSFVALIVGVLLFLLTGYHIATYTKGPTITAEADAALSEGSEHGSLSEGRSKEGLSTEDTDSEKQRERRQYRKDDGLCTLDCNSTSKGSEVQKPVPSELLIVGNGESARSTIEKDFPGEQVPPEIFVESSVVPKEFRMLIKVLAFNRLSSLTRCLESLARADYGGDTVKLHILVDHFRFDESLEFPTVEVQGNATGEESGPVDDLRTVVSVQKGPTQGNSYNGVAETGPGHRSLRLGSLSGKQLSESGPVFLRGDDVDAVKEVGKAGVVVKEENLREISEGTLTGAEGGDAKVESDDGYLLTDLDRETGETGAGKLHKEIAKLTRKEEKSDTNSGVLSSLPGEGDVQTASGPGNSGPVGIDHQIFHIEREQIGDAEEGNSRMPSEYTEKNNSKDGTEEELQDSLAGKYDAKVEAQKQGAGKEKTRKGKHFSQRNKSKPIDEDLMEAHAILKYVDDFKWVHGPKDVHYRSQNVGLQGQWVEAWWPSSNDEFALILEDDLELSPFFYRYLRSIIATYYYDSHNFDPSIYGISLQRPRFVPGKGGNPLDVNSTNALFLYQMVGTWGQLFFPKPWKEFRLWYDNRKSKGVKPILKGMVTNGWYKKLGERIWTPWFVKFVYSRSYFNLYTNFQSERALSVSHRDAGVNYNINAGPDSQLITLEKLGNISLWEMVPLKLMQSYDYCFSEVKRGRLAKTLSQLDTTVASIQVKGTVLMVNIVGVTEVLVRNWVCKMKGLGINQYIILGEDGEFAEDLARQGHAVMCSQLSTDMKQIPAHFGKDQREGINDVVRDLIAVQAVQSVLKLGYSVWLTRADAIWIRNALASVSTHIEEVKADIAGIESGDTYNLGLMYIRSSPEAVRIWGKLVDEFLAAAKAAPGNEQIEQGKSAWQNFSWSVQSEENVRVKALVPNLLVEFEDLPSLGNLSMAETHIVLLDELAKCEPSSFIPRLKALDLWVVDSDLACRRVSCQPPRKAKSTSMLVGHVEP